MYVLGVDFGGGASKATLLNRQGKVVATATAEYPTHYGEGGKAEQSPMDWYNAACQNVRRVLQGVNAEVDLMDRSVKAQFKYADKIGAKYVAVIGGNELAEGKANVKCMADGTNEMVAFEDMVTYFQGK